jgi:hypothetical protein
MLKEKITKEGFENVFKTLFLYKSLILDKLQ